MAEAATGCGETSARGAEDALAETLAGDLRFTGDMISYDSPANSDLLTVCERRKGLPVALGLLYLVVARRCGLGVRGSISQATSCFGSRPTKADRHRSVLGR